jgi:hypothetical protein
LPLAADVFGLEDADCVRKGNFRTLASERGNREKISTVFPHDVFPVGCDN